VDPVDAMAKDVKAPTEQNSVRSVYGSERESCGGRTPREGEL